MPTNFRQTPDEVAYLAKASGATGMICNAAFPEHVAASRRDCPDIGFVIAIGAADFGPSYDGVVEEFLGQRAEEARVDIAIERMLACAEAGASSLYPVGFHDEATLTRLTSALPLPVNAIANPAEGDLAMYARAGAGRISFGPIWQMGLAKVSAEWLGRWK